MRPDRARMVLAGVAIAAVVGLVPECGDAALCRTKRGRLFVRDACKRRETAVNLPKGETGTAGTSRVRARLRDANDRVVGYLNAIGEVLIPHDGIVLHARASIDGFRPLDAGVLFEEPGCTGQAFVLDTATLYRRLVVVGASAYHAGDPLGSRFLWSELSGSTPAGCTGTGKTYDATSGLCCATLSLARRAMAAPAVPFDLRAFPLPFRVEVER